MSAKIETSSRLDTAKLALSALVLGVAVMAFYYFSEQSTLLRVLGLLVAAGVALAIAYQTELGRSFWAFVNEARAEVRKVVWPTRQETVQTTLIVIVMVIAVGIILWLLDMFLLWAVRLLTGQGG